MEKQNLEFEIKLPSDPNVVTPESIWSFIETIGKTGSTFTKNDLISNGLKTKSDSTISRVLSYLKYLGIIDESRIKLGKDETQQQVQRFKRETSKEVNDMFYELKANRRENAKKNFALVLQHNQLYQAFSTEFFRNNETKTFTDLEHYLREKHTSKSPSQILSGGKFIIALFQLCDLAEVEGNDIRLKRTATKTQDNENLYEESYKVQQNEDRSTETLKINEPQELGYYTVSIRGQNLNATYRIASEKELNVVKMALELIKEYLPK